MSKENLKKPIIDEILELLREQSTQTVLFHAFIAEQLGLNTTDHKALDLIAKASEMTAGKLAEMTGLTTGAVTGVIDRLEKAGFVRRAFDPNDRRRIIIQFIPETAEKIFSVFAPMHQQTNALLESYSEQELAVIHDFMRRAIELSVKVRTEKISGR